MKIPLRCVGLVAVSGLFSACAYQPVGVAQREWDAWSPEQRAEYRQQDFQRAQVADLARFTGALGSLQDQP